MRCKCLAPKCLVVSLHLKERFIRAKPTKSTCCLRVRSRSSPPRPPYCLYPPLHSASNRIREGETVRPAAPLPSPPSPLSWAPSLRDAPDGGIGVDGGADSLVRVTFLVNYSALCQNRQSKSLQSTPERSLLIFRGIVANSL